MTSGFVFAFINATEPPSKTLPPFLPILLSIAASILAGYRIYIAIVQAKIPEIGASRTVSQIVANNSIGSKIFAPTERTSESLSNDLGKAINSYGQAYWALCIMCLVASYIILDNQYIPSKTLSHIINAPIIRGIACATSIYMASAFGSLHCFYLISKFFIKHNQPKG